MNKPAKPAPANAPDATSSPDNHIARRAHEISKQNGKQPGQNQQNWQQAERELTQEKAPAGYPEQQETPSPGRTGTEPTLKNVDDDKQREGRKPATRRTSRA